MEGDTGKRMKVFLCCVSSEFRSYRLKLANQLGALKGQPCEVKVQEDFEQGGVPRCLGYGTIFD
jgi:hypothetical protein